MATKNVKRMMVIFGLIIAHLFTLGNGGCDESAELSREAAALYDTAETTAANAESGVKKAADKVKKAYSGHVTKSQVKAAIKAIEDSGFGVSASAVGAELTKKYGECNASHDLYKAVGDRCEKMGLSRNCTSK
jgi:hypothetical protein